MIGAALGLASSAISGIVGLAQMNKANKQIQTAKNAQTAAMNEFKNIREQNPFAAVQVPTESFNLAAQRTAGALADVGRSAQSAGAEGVIGAAGQIGQQASAANLETAAAQSEAMYNRDVAQATAQGGINQRQALRQEDIAGMKLGQAMQGQQTAEANKQAGFEGLTGGITGTMEGISGLVGLYGEKKDSKLADLLKFTPPNQSDLENEPTIPFQ